MFILSETNLADYIRTCPGDKLAAIDKSEINDVVVAGGGLVSSVFRANVAGENLYFKQAIPGRLDKVKEMVGGEVPDDAFVVWYDERQFAEVKALQIAARAVPEGFVPKVYHHDAVNHVMVLSEVCGRHGIVLAEVMNEAIAINHAEILGTNIARIANYTYGKYEQLRDPQLEKKIKKVKYRYEIEKVWDNITNKNTNKRIIKEVSDFVDESSAMGSVLVHGDYHERNILVCGETCGTFDLEESHWGDPIEDIGKLAASYILRIIYFEKLKQTAFDATNKLLDSYFATLTIPESRENLETRLRVMIAGCLMLRIDGISSLWLPWVHQDAKKEMTRRLAVALVLEDKEISTQSILDSSVC